jgi:hypothetical protein
VLVTDDFLKNGQQPMAHACNPSYSGGRDQEDCSLKPAWGKSLRDLISKKKKKSHHQKRAGAVAQGVGSEFKLQYHKKISEQLKK